MPTPNRTKRGIPKPLTFRAPDGKSSIRAPKRHYTETLGRTICERIMLGDSLTKICEDPRMPGKRAVVRWLSSPERADFREMYYYAKRVQAEFLVDEIIEIADDSTKDWKPVYNNDGELTGIKTDNEAIQRSRVRIDTRKWLAAKLIPRVYGDNRHVELDATGDLAELLKSVKNKDSGLPPPIEGEKG